MIRFLRIAQQVNVLPLAIELHRATHLWDAETARKTYPGTPHAAMSDIWVRFRPKGQLKDITSHQEEYRCEFWPAWRELPALRPLAFNLMAAVQAVELGSILITRLSPGGEILPHSDRGSWAAEFYNTKLHLTVAGASVSRCAGEAVTMSAGDVFTFDNLLEHSVENHGETDRIAVIFSMRCEA